MAISPSINFSTISSTRKAVKSSADAIKNTQSILFKRTKMRKEIFGRQTILKNRRKENERRRENEDLLEARRLDVNPVKGPIQLIQGSTKGFFERLLSFLGYVTAGWVINNLPTWIAMGKEFIARLQKAKDILFGFVTGVKNIFTGFGNLLSAAFQNLINFDLFDTSNRVSGAFGELVGSLNDVGSELEQAIKLITTPLSEGLASGQDAPSTGQERTDQGAYPDTQPYSGSENVSGGNADFWTLVAVAAREDGDPQGRADVAQSIYNRLASGAYSGKTIRELITAKGQYQPTWDYPRKRGDRNPNPEWLNITDAESAAKAAKMDVGSIKSVAASLTNPTLQKNAAEFVQGRTDFTNYTKRNRKGQVLRKSGDNYFGWDWNYKGNVVGSTPNFGTTTSTSSQQSSGQLTSQSSLPKLPPTDTLSGGVQRYGARRRGGRQHAGTDFDISGNQKFYSRIGGIVTKVGYDPNPRGYGHYIDIYNAQLGVYERIAEGARVLVKKGQRIQPGQAVVQGEGPSGVIHYEIRKNSGYGFVGTTDPLKFLSSARISSQPDQPQISSTQTQQRQQLAQQIAQERNGPTVIISETPTPPPQIISSGNNQTSMLSIEVSEFDLLNRFMKNKLLLDLTYL
jgi:hypothetical protein